MKRVIHVNQHIIRANKKALPGEEEKPLTMKSYKDNIRANEIILQDDRGKEVARVVYRPNKPLSCGAHVWIEVENDDIVVDGTHLNG